MPVGGFLQVQRRLQGGCLLVIRVCFSHFSHWMEEWIIWHFYGARVCIKCCKKMADI
jgi:hypothetical protein